MRRRAVLSAVCLLWTFAALAASAQEEDFEAFAPATPEGAAVALLPPGTAGGAEQLGFSSRCSETRRRTAVIALRWQAGEEVADQRVDLTKFRDGFEKGRYETSGRLPRHQRSAGLEGPEPGIRYYWRVLTETPAGWVPSTVERFEVPVCPWDEPSQPFDPQPGVERAPGRPLAGEPGSLISPGIRVRRLPGRPAGLVLGSALILLLGLPALPTGVQTVEEFEDVSPDNSDTDGEDPDSASGPGDRLGVERGGSHFGDEIAAAVHGLDEALLCPAVIEHQTGALACLLVMFLPAS